MNTILYDQIKNIHHNMLNSILLTYDNYEMNVLTDNIGLYLSNRKWRFIQY